ncbi:1-acyl-sn-glycerol-3-phosphate acyltransferase [Paucilactobacillus oligofermentans DSM 15707 = LMG 22743]|uniref:1-acyl-sn-glycerol-3-phosphate acyltransferase n=1 Tax=Paucilactobacillus oligofermentans DSM 15707 = LMG 22743 TaxID=1423778 RepID=A0A0R1RE57_9LACO|nr:1-acyl-sn-glycerol-3-phosphate acyltransferase [Paucilactobacillus oligofermentans]KRL54702.1 1-acyl-sn-glycerol-3-phosphate acyltransferase [Paucilactobacillus oligofermentans DSM 15707 = LMG 22743]CUS26387.1 1-acyl-sn-glycerol-3-phosphate acyltransferase PlsC [Paucilactobacillus oligofermentans DSM 15707 = LMG 22743]
MFYSFLRGLVRILLYILNGKPTYLNKENLPEGNYILVGPHRTWFDPVYFALAGSPKKFSFMAKQELFENKFYKFVLDHMFAYPVDRINPGPSVIKTPVNYLKKTDLSTIIFPSGTRYSEQMKGGALVIAKLSGVPLIPAVYQGPMTFKGLLTRKKTTVAFGKPIMVDKKIKLDDDNQAEYEARLQQSFNDLDQQIDPNFHYVLPVKKESK